MIAAAPNLHNGCGCAACHRTTQYRDGGKHNNPSNPFPAFIHMLFFQMLDLSTVAPTGLRVANSGKSQSMPCSSEMRGVPGHFCSHKQAILQAAVSPDYAISVTKNACLELTPLTPAS